MRVLVAVKRCLDYSARLRLKTDGSNVVRVAVGFFGIAK